jgi:hypothetical protein
MVQLPRKTVFTAEMDKNQTPNADRQRDRQADRRSDRQTLTDTYLELLDSKKAAVLASNEPVFFTKYLKTYHFPVQNRMI